MYSYSESSGNIERVNIGSRGIQGNIDPVYDKLGRVTEKTASFSTGSTGLFWNRHTYDYKSAGGNESVLVSSVTSEIRRSSGTSVVSAKTWNYTYDGNGNITMITDVSGTVQNRYYYDSLGQLTREDNRALGKTYVWTYDKAGNIQSRKTYAFTTGSLGSVQESVTYQYGETEWKDLLTKYGDVNITYDEIGNPSNGGNGALTWEGRRLKSYVNASGQRLTYDYNADGIRVSTEHYNGMSRVTMRTEYVLNGTQITQESMYRDGEEEYTFVYIYDENGSPVAYKFRRASYAEGEYDLYFYEKNLQGDVIGIYDETGTKVVEYIYNAWGEVTTNYLTTQSLTALYQNPFRYRGYYYDTITGFYYVSSRYYDPEVGRWISPEPNVYEGEFDENAGLIGYNVYAYCANNPVNNLDPTGEFVISTAVLIGIGIGALIGGVAGGAYGYNKAVKSNVPKGQRWKYVVGYGLGGAVIGGVIGGFVGYGVGVALGAKASSGLVIKSVSKALSSVSRNTMHHIMQSKHAWGRVLRNATWNNVKSLINTTMKKGATTLINKQGRALIYEAVRNNVVVRYAVIDGIIKISDAWVKTR